MEDYVNLAQKCARLAAGVESLFDHDLDGGTSARQRVARMGASRASVIAIA
jgi:hypothetical protein